MGAERDVGLARRRIRVAFKQLFPLCCSRIFAAPYSVPVKAVTVDAALAMNYGQ